MAKEGTCSNCGRYTQVEGHHIILKSEIKALIECELNIIPLCESCHRGTFGVHGKNGERLKNKLRLNFQNEMELLFLKKEFTREEIGQALQIKENALNGLCKLIRQDKGMFARDNIIIAIMGGQRIEESEGTEEYESYGNFQKIR